MTWDPVWEQVFRTSNWGRYPPEELIRFVARVFFSAPNRKAVKILELGCGTGANLWFLAREGFDVYGIDGAPTAIAQAEQRLGQEGLTANMQVGDILSLHDLYPPASFDAIVDVACLQHNPRKSAERILDQVVTALKPRGRVFSMMVAQGSYGDGLGKEIEPGTFVEITQGPLQGKGLIHFSSLREVEDLFGRFTYLQIEYSDRSMNYQEQIYKHWVIEGAKC